MSRSRRSPWGQQWQRWILFFLLISPLLTSLIKLLSSIFCQRPDLNQILNLLDQGETLCNIVPLSLVKLTPLRSVKVQLLLSWRRVHNQVCIVHLLQNLFSQYGQWYWVKDSSSHLCFPWSQPLHPPHVSRLIS